MARRNRYRAKKRVYRKVKKMYTRRKKAFANSSRSVIRCSFSLQQGNANGGPMSVTIPLDFPGWINISGIPQRLDAVPTQYGRYFNLFDEYLVEKLQITVINPFNCLVSGGGAQVYPTGNAFYPIMYTGYDYDDYAVPTSVTQIQALQGYRKRQLLTRPIKTRMYHKTKQNKTNWLNTGSVNPNSIPNGPNNITSQLPTRGSLKMLLENCVNANVGYELDIEWTVKFRGQRTTNPEEYVEETNESNPYTVDTPPIIIPKGELAVTPIV